MPKVEKDKAGKVLKKGQYVVAARAVFSNVSLRFGRVLDVNEKGVLGTLTGHWTDDPVMQKATYFNHTSNVLVIPKSLIPAATLKRINKACESY